MKNKSYTLTLTKEEVLALTGLLVWYTSRPGFESDTYWVGVGLKNTLKKLGQVNEEIYGQKN